VNRTFSILTLLFFTTFLQAQTGYVATGNNGSNQTTETYVVGSPTSAAGNRKVTSVYKDSLYFYSHYPTIRFSKFTSAKNDGQPTNIFWSDALGTFKKSPFSEVKISKSQVVDQDIYMEGFGLSKVTTSPNHYKFDINQDLMMTVAKANTSIDSIMDIVGTKAETTNVYTKTQADATFLKTLTELDPTVSTAAKSITGAQTSNWNIAYGWGNHAGLYKPVSYVPTWTDISGKPSFFDGNYNSLSNKPNLGSYLTSETDPVWMSEKSSYSTKTASDALYKPIGYTPTYSEITGKPTLFNGAYGSLTGIPTTFVPIAHTHAISDVTGLQISLDNKIEVGATIPYSTLSGKPVIPSSTEQLTNNSGFITGYTETDPIWSVQKTNYSTTAQADALYQSKGTYLTSEVDGSTTNEIQQLSIAGQSLTLTNGGNTITLPTNSYTQGTGIGISGNTITNTAPDQTVTLTPGNRISITGTYPNFTIAYIEPTTAIVSRPLNTNFTISSTKQAIVGYTVTCSVTNPLLIGTSSASAYIEYSTDGGVTWKLPAQNGNSSGVGITVTLQLTNGQTGILLANIPANALTRIRTAITGTASVTYVTGFETY